MFLSQLAKATRSAPIPVNTVRRLPDNIPNRKERKTYLHFHFHTFTEEITMGTAVLSFLLCSSRPFHSETVRQRSTTVLRQWQQEGFQQPTDRLVNLHLHINQTQLEWISFPNSPGWMKNPWQSLNYRKSNQHLIRMDFPIVHVQQKHATRVHQNAAKFTSFDWLIVLRSFA